ncbi:unnamed protein product, partial [Amoebophrya sp. A120]
SPRSARRAPEAARAARLWLPPGRPPGRRQPASTIFNYEWTRPRDEPAPVAQACWYDGLCGAHLIVPGTGAGRVAFMRAIFCCVSTWIRSSLAFATLSRVCLHFLRLYLHGCLSGSPRDSRGDGYFTMRI